MKEAKNGKKALFWTMERPIFFIRLNRYDLNRKLTEYSNHIFYTKEEFTAEIYIYYQKSSFYKGNKTKNI